MSSVDQPKEPVASIPATSTTTTTTSTSTKKAPSYRTARSASGSSASQASDNDDSDFTDSLSDSDYETDYYDMESTPVIARAVPALPVKSTLRASRTLDDLIPLKMGSDEEPVLSSQAAPHAVYLSSEEDASSSADDFSDFDFESDTENSPDSPTSRSSHEIMARIVSVVYSGKPSIIEVAPRSPVSASPARPRLRRTTTDSSLQQQSFVPSKPTRYSTFVTTGELEKSARPGFLHVDPFPSPPEEDALPKSPAGAKFKRSFSIARRCSKSTAEASLYSLDSPSAQTLQLEQSEEKQSTPRASANYQDVLSAARTNTQSRSTQQAGSDDASVTSPSGSKSKSRFAFIGRRRGIRA